MRKSRLSKHKQKKLLELFVAGATARCAAILVEENTKTAAYYFKRLREIIAHHLEQESLEVFDGAIELDESYFGGTRKCQRGRGSSGKVDVFGILKRHGKVYTKIVKDTKTQTLMPIIKDKIRPDSIVYTDNYRSYHALDVSEFHHLRINHYKEFVDTKNKRNHINGIENFWSQATPYA